MVSSLSCVASNGLSGEQTASLFSIVCSMDRSACDGISTDGTAGIYGTFSMCDAHSKLSFAMHQYYQNQNQVPTACDFKGNAKIQSASAKPSCSALLSKAGFTPAPPISTAAASGHSKKSAAGAVRVTRSGVQLLKLGVFLTIAGLTGLVLGIIAAWSGASLVITVLAAVVLGIIVAWIGVSRMFAELAGVVLVLLDEVLAIASANRNGK
jgi:1,3-beta-glucanosyltransferase GAS1